MTGASGASRPAAEDPGAPGDPAASPVGEFELLERLAPRLAPDGPELPVGYGDDAAVIDLGGAAACVTVDAIVEGRHFVWELSTPDDVGWKAVAVNVSDLAAMGADPTAAVVALGRPADLGASSVEALYDGMAAAAAHWGLDLAGGDVVRTDQLVVALTLLGRIDPARAVRRRGARPGDRLVCVGSLGAAAAGLELGIAGHRTPEPLLAAHRRPRGLVTAGRALADAGTHAMIDISDGLGADLGHVAHASGVAIDVWGASLPVPPEVWEAADALGKDPWSLVCAGGEDFALVAAVAPDDAAEVARRAGAAEGVPAAVVGEILESEGEPRVTLHLDGQRRDLRRLGYDHYRDDDPRDQGGPT
ncbi:thiamine-phosphate kinase [Egibacter rhizosphaerae]|uniref:Thiamine-monophosphate kinase n=1 Tax=Egibacter rhizosphaerae TaxID=1670831 RepID=A0A411YCL6_9ACTN|nr:thiamine-phosphate kinase [Egibacter rhizosphaerae]QBI18993.1 thiamine-phosphate kinase [Egibacter rhizosphaerae]